MTSAEQVVQVDVVIVGSGAGGGTMARALAGQDASVLLLERGDWLVREPGNSDPTVVWHEKRYRSEELWLNRRDREFRPFMHYVVGGNTTMWGAALLRLRETDFAEIEFPDGLSPAWPISYADLAPWYDRAEALYQVHGRRGSDPTDPPRGEFPYAEVQHEPEVEWAVQGLREQGLHPSYLPLGLVDPGNGGCVLCSTCNSFPCQVRGKADTDVVCVSDAVKADNVDLWTGARVERLVTDGPGHRVAEVHVRRDGELVRVQAKTVVLSAGAVNSAALLLGSADERHPDGLANSSGLVGRRYMAHLATMMEAMHPLRVNPTVFQKTVAVNDFYLAQGDRPPLGHIQSQGRAHAPIIKQVLPGVPMSLTQGWVDRGLDWLAMTEDLPRPENRVVLDPRGPDQARLHPEQHRRARPAGARGDGDAAVAGLLGRPPPRVQGPQHHPPVRHRRLRAGPAHLGPGHDVPHPRHREPLRRRRLVLPVVGRRESRADDHRPVPARGRPPRPLRALMLDRPVGDPV